METWKTFAYSDDFQILVLQIKMAKQRKVRCTHPQCLRQSSVKTVTFQNRSSQTVQDPGSFRFPSDRRERSSSRPEEPKPIEHRIRLIHRRKPKGRIWCRQWTVQLTSIDMLSFFLSSLGFRRKRGRTIRNEWSIRLFLKRYTLIYLLVTNFDFFFNLIFLEFF